MVPNFLLCCLKASSILAEAKRRVQRPRFATLIEQTTAASVIAQCGHRMAGVERSCIRGGYGDGRLADLGSDFTSLARTAHYRRPRALLGDAQQVGRGIASDRP